MKEEYQHESNWMMASGWRIKTILQKINTKYWKKWRPTHREACKP